jgi:hypothetical protein
MVLTTSSESVGSGEESIPMTWPPGDTLRGNSRTLRPPPNPMSAARYLAAFPLGGHRTIVLLFRLTRRAM